MKWFWIAMAMTAAWAQDTAKPLQTQPVKPVTTPAPTAAPVAGATPAPSPAPAAKTTPEKPVSPAEAMRLSIEKQRESVRKQAESLGTWIKPGESLKSPNSAAGVAPPADCEPLAEDVLAPLIESNSKAQAVKPELIRAVMEQESGYRPCAVSPKGAQGLMQLMPGTAQELGVGDAFDPKENVAGGAKLLKQLVDKYKGDLSRALAAYNAGAAAVDQAGGIPDIAETKDYVDAILKKMGTPPAPVVAPAAIQPVKNR